MADVARSCIIHMFDNTSSGGLTTSQPNRVRQDLQQVAPLVPLITANVLSKDVNEPAQGALSLFRCHKSVTVKRQTRCAMFM